MATLDLETYQTPTTVGLPRTESDRESDRVGPMLGFDPKAARAAWTVALVALALYLLYLVQHVLLIFVFALFFAYMVAPLIELLAARFPKSFPRVYVIAIVYIWLLVTLGLTSGWLISNAVGESVALAQKMPALVHEKEQWIRTADLPAWAQPLRTQALNWLAEMSEQGAARLLPVVRDAGTRAASLAGNLIYVILVPILSFLMLKDAAGIRQGLLEAMGRGRYHEFADSLFADLDLMLARYIRALILQALATLVAYGVFYGVAGVPYGFLLAGLAAVLEFIPFVGPFAAMATACIVALVNGYGHVWWIAVFYLVVRMVQDYVLQPKLMSEGIELHPLLVIFGAIAGEHIGGIAGMFLSLPLMAVARVLAIRIREAHMRKEWAEQEEETPVLVHTVE